MNITVKGMSLPLSCSSCFISGFGNTCFCGRKISGEEWNATNKRPDWCPLSEAFDDKAFDDNGLEDEIRCLICTNRNKSDRGCDGACHYDEHLLSDIVKAIDERTHLKQQECEDVVSREEAIRTADETIPKDWFEILEPKLRQLPPSSSKLAANLRPTCNQLETVHEDAVSELIREIKKWIHSGNRNNADYFIVDQIEELIAEFESKTPAAIPKSSGTETT